MSIDDVIEILQGRRAELEAQINHLEREPRKHRESIARLSIQQGEADALMARFERQRRYEAMAATKDEQSPRIEILHYRDSDTGCYHTVWVDGVQLEASVFDIDPGRGQVASEWVPPLDDLRLMCSTEQVAEAVFSAYVEAVENNSEHVDEGDFGHCDTCGAPCDEDGCLRDRSHKAALDVDEQPDSGPSTYVEPIHAHPAGEKPVAYGPFRDVVTASEFMDLRDLSDSDYKIVER